MPLIMRKAVLLAKKEVTYGVDPTPVGANAILVRNMTLTPLESDFVSRDLIRPFFGSSEQMLVGSRVKLECEVEIAGSGVAGTPPKWAPLIEACAFTETDTVSDDTYKPNSTAAASVTLYYNLDGVLHEINGARGDVSFELTAKQIPVMKFSFTGLYVGVIDAAAATPDYSGFMQPKPVDTTWTPTGTLHGVTPIISGLSIAMNNQVVHRKLIGAESVIIVDRKPTGQITFEASLVATKDWWTIARNATLAAMQVIHGTTAGNIVQIDAPKVQIGSPTYQDQDGVAMLQCDLTFTPNTGNDEISIVVK
jgi:hypothetical protein